MKSLKSIFARAALPAVMLFGLSHEATAQTPTSINACESITQSGNYALSADLQSVSADCLVVENVANVTIDGQGHTIKVLGGSNPGAAGIHFMNAVGAVVQNITFQGGNTSLSVVSENSQSISVFNSQFNGAGAYADSASTYFYLASNPSMLNSPITSSASPTYIFYNIMQNTLSSANVAIGISGGAGHYVWGNQIDGGWDGTNSNNGLDDAIFLTDVSNSNIYGNTLAHVWDTGIETAGFLNNSYIGYNNVSHAGINAVGGWWNDGHTNYGASWTGNTVTSNTATSTPTFIKVFSNTNTNFLNNTISNNTLGNYGLESGWINFPSRGDTRQHNSFTGNNFGVAYGPYISPPQMAADGGGNTCIGPEPSQPSPYPLACIPPQPPSH